MYTHTHTHTLMHTCTHAHTLMHAHTHTHTHARIHACTQTSMHAHNQKRLFQEWVQLLRWINYKCTMYLGIELRIRNRLDYPPTSWRWHKQRDPSQCPPWSPYLPSFSASREKVKMSEPCSLIATKTTKSWLLLTFPCLLSTSPPSSTWLPSSSSTVGSLWVGKAAQRDWPNVCAGVSSSSS